MTGHEAGADAGKAMRDDGTVVNLANAMVSKAVVGGTLNCTVTAAVIASDQACVEVLLQADPTNLVDVLVGDASSQPIILTPGQHITVPISNLNLIKAKSASSTAILNWLART